MFILQILLLSCLNIVVAIDLTITERSASNESMQSSKSCLFLQSICGEDRSLVNYETFEWR